MNRNKLFATLTLAALVSLTACAQEDPAFDDPAEEPVTAPPVEDDPVWDDPMDPDTPTAIDTPQIDPDTDDDWQ